MTKKDTVIDWNDIEQKRAYQRQKNKEWRERQSDEKRKEGIARTLEWHAQHKDRVAENFDRYYKANREKHLEYLRQYRIKNRDKLNAKAKERAARQKELDKNGEV